MQILPCKALFKIGTKGIIYFHFKYGHFRISGGFTSTTHVCQETQLEENKALGKDAHMALEQSCWDSYKHWMQAWAVIG